MPFSRQNDYFYKEFKGGDGSTYRLEFYPGYEVDTTGFTANEFPDDFIFNEVEVDNSFTNDVPFGLPKARSLSLSVDLNAQGDWVDVADWIVRGRSDNTRTVIGREMFIPNRWVLRKDSGISDIPFHGYQIPAEKEYDIAKDSIKFDLTVLGAEKVILDELQFSDLSLTSTVEYNNTAGYYDLTYPSGVGSGKLQLRGFDHGGVTYKFLSIEDYFDEVDSKAGDIMAAFVRGSVSNPRIFAANLDSIWKFYEPDTTTRAQGKTVNQVEWTTGVADAENKLLFVYEEDHDGEVEGALVDGSPMSFYNEGSVWAWLRKFCDFFMLKPNIKHNRDNYNIFFNPIFDSVSSNINIEDLSQSDFKLKQETKITTTASCYNMGVKTNDPDTVTKRILTGNIDGDSEESTIEFNNYIMNYFDFVPLVEFNGHSAGNNTYITPIAAFEKRHAHYRVLYGRVSENDLHRVHQDCTLEMGDSVTLSGDTTYESHPYPELTTDYYDTAVTAWFNKKIVPFLKEIHKAEKSRLPYYGVGKIRNDAIDRLFGNNKHGTIEVTLSDMEVMDLGETCTTNLQNISNLSIIQSMGLKAIFTSIKHDIIKDEAKCKLFLRGDV